MAEMINAAQPFVPILRASYGKAAMIRCALES
jgi:hypothetical protein